MLHNCFKCKQTLVCTKHLKFCFSSPLPDPCHFPVKVFIPVFRRRWGHSVGSAHKAPSYDHPSIPLPSRGHGSALQNEPVRECMQMCSLEQWNWLPTLRDECSCCVISDVRGPYCLGTSTHAVLQWDWGSTSPGECSLRQDPPPLEAILVIFGRRALIFFLFESSWKKMKNDATFVRMRSGDHLGDAKMSKKGTSLRRI